MNSRRAHCRARTRPPVRVLAIAVVVVVGVFQTSSEAWALDIEETLWGFEGTAFPNDFTPLSVKVSNPSPDPFEGTLQLRKTVSVGNYADVTLEEPIFLAGNSARWVQFYPYTIRPQEEWILSWGPGTAFPLPQVRHGPRAKVLLYESAGIANARGGIKGFPENLFPPHIAAAAGLEAVVVDHVPRWEESRRQAFLDWLDAGGVLHLLPGLNGKIPEFSESLSVLNSPLDRRRIGAGWIVKHRPPEGPLNSGYAKKEILDWKPGETPPDEVDLRRGVQGEKPNPYQGADWNGDTAFLGQLKRLTHPEHNWLLINLLSWMYILLIFPGCYLLGRQRADFRITFGALLGIVVFFSLAFALVGRRGYGESTTVNSIAVAKAIRPSEYSVAQWSNVFVVQGDLYDLHRNGSGALYSAAQEAEVVPGVVQTTGGSHFRVDIPPFSSRELVSRYKAKGPPIQLALEEIDAGLDLRRLKLKCAGVPAAPLRIMALYGTSFYTLQQEGDKLTLTAPAGTIVSYLQLNWQMMQYDSAWYDRDKKTAEKTYTDLLHPAIARSLGVHNYNEMADFKLPLDRVRVYIYAPMPDEFFVNPELFGKQMGYVLYVIDVPVTSET
jgi:hypothetical protein